VQLGDKDLMPYQVEGRDKILASDCLYLGDDPGLGKTAQVIRACDHLPPSYLLKGILIVCPASLRSNWQQEWEKWNGPKCELYILSYQEAVKDCQGKVLGRFKRNIGVLGRTWGLVAFDEAHALKACGGKTQRAMSGLIYNIWKEKSDDEETPDKWRRVYGVSAHKTVMMSGTPVLNRPIDIFPAIRHMRPNDWPSKTKFELRYCDAHVDRYGRWVTDGYSNLGELHSVLINSGIFIKRKKKDVLSQLPPKRRQLLNVDVSNTMLNKCNTLIAASLDAVNITDSVADLAWEVESLDEFENLSVEHIAKIRAQLGEAKVDPTIDYLLEQEQLGVLPEKLVIFAHHRKVVERISEALNYNGISASIYYGGMSDEQKNIVVQNFQHGKTRVFVGSIVAAGVGLTLTAADTAIILEPSYVPAENVQAEDRLHRIGAHRPVLIQYITLANSLDHRILTLVVEKMRMIEELFG